MKLMEQCLNARYGHIIISYEKNGQIKGFFLKISFFLMFSLFVQHFCLLDKAADSLIRYRTLIPCLGELSICLSIPVSKCLSECLWHVTWPKSSSNVHRFSSNLQNRHSFIQTNLKKSLPHRLQLLHLLRLPHHTDWLAQAECFQLC